MCTLAEMLLLFLKYNFRCELYLSHRTLAYFFSDFFACVVNHLLYVFQEEERRELALITLQKIIRGRAVQNMVRPIFHFYYTQIQTN